MFEVPDPELAVFGKEKSKLYVGNFVIEQTTNSMKFDYCVVSPLAMTVNVIIYRPAVVVARDTDLHGIEISLTVGQDGYVIPVIKVVTA